ncbi:MAG: DUF3408 domain-containing protein [Muribaculum sp.]|nr:DUF3408 domain-containing protein [Muribaculum sp.]
MAKKSDVQITPDNFLDSYKPVSPGRKPDKTDAPPQAELPKVEAVKASPGENETASLQSRKDDVVITPQEYQSLFFKPNLGKSMRYGKTYYVMKEDIDRFKALKQCFGEGFENFPLSVFVHNLLEYHFERYADLLAGMIEKLQIPNPFKDKK